MDFNINIRLDDFIVYIPRNSIPGARLYCRVIYTGYNTDYGYMDLDSNLEKMSFKAAWEDIVSNPDKQTSYCFEIPNSCKEYNELLLLILENEYIPESVLLIDNKYKPYELIDDKDIINSLENLAFEDGNKNVFTINRRKLLRFTSYIKTTQDFLMNSVPDPRTFIKFPQSVNDVWFQVENDYYAIRCENINNWLKKNLRDTELLVKLKNLRTEMKAFEDIEFDYIFKKAKETNENTNAKINFILMDRAELLRKTITHDGSPETIYYLNMNLSRETYNKDNPVIIFTFIKGREPTKLWLYFKKTIDSETGDVIDNTNLDDKIEISTFNSEDTD